MTEQDLLKQIKKNYSDILKDNLVGIYVHGSIAFGCFHWEQSDIDFLVIVRRAPSLQEKIQLISALLTLEPYAPPKGFEMSVIREEFCRPFSYPTPYELHFSNAYREICRANPAAFCAGMHGTDKDLAAHITVVRAVGQTLCGKPINDVFDEMPKAYYLDSISCDIENAVQDVADHPVYIILNLCRVLAFVREGSVLSKEQGGTWGIEHLPQVYHSLIAGARDCYCKNQSFTPNPEIRRCFVEFMLAEIAEN